MRGLPVVELLAGEALLIDVDAEPGAPGTMKVKPSSISWMGKKSESSKPIRRSVGVLRHSSQAKFGTAAAKCTEAAVQTGPSGLCTMRSA